MEFSIHLKGIVAIFLVASTICVTGSVSGLYEHRNNKTVMEDRSIRIENCCGYGIYAVLDGHGGKYAAEKTHDFLSRSIQSAIVNITEHPEQRQPWSSNGDIDFQQMLLELFERAQTKLEEAKKSNKHDSGTTCILVIAAKMKLIVANIGDSRAVLCDSAGRSVKLSNDHKPNSDIEKKRIISNGGKIVVRGVPRLAGLAVSRSLGDHAEKQRCEHILSEPDIYTFSLVKYRPKFMIVASDGLWDVIGSQKAVDFIENIYEKEADFGATLLAKEAIKRRTQDNITVMIVVFHDGYYEV